MSEHTAESDCTPAHLGPEVELRLERMADAANEAEIRWLIGEWLTEIAAAVERGKTDDDHAVTGCDGRWACTCGWEPALGEAVYRAHDKHLLDVRSSPACPTCLLVRDEPDEPIQPGDYYTVDPTSPRRCPSCGLVPARDSEGARRVAAARVPDVPTPPALGPQDQARALGIEWPPPLPEGLRSSPGEATS